MAAIETTVSGLRVIRGGLMAGLAQTAAVYVIAAAFGLPVSGVSQFLGGVLVGASPAAVTVGRWMLAVIALIWAFVFRRIGPSLPGAAWQRGALYGVLVWAFSTGVLFPLLAAVSESAPRPGLFGLGLGGASAAFTALTAHIVYGIVLARAMAADRRPAVPDPGPA